ncbi:MAG: metal-dependent hydrolase [Thermococcus sp.]|nr:metal-dependent hydrolase [Thermococcus sp.]
MNYEEHVVAGIVSYPLLIFLAGLLKHFLQVPFRMSTAAMMLGYALYVFGSDLPDIDHPDALIHRGAKAVVAVLIGSAVYTHTISSIDFGEPWKTLTAAWGVGTAGALAAWYGFSELMPRHRGIIHSLAFALVYGLLSLLFADYGLKMSWEEALFVGFAAFSGYTLHLLLDRSVKLV